MTTVMDQAIGEQPARYIADFVWAEPELARSGSARLETVRRTAIERFTELGFPTSRNEDWKFTSLSRLSSIAFERAAREADFAAAEKLVSGLPCSENRLVFVNGFYAASLSTRAAGATVGNLRDSDASEIDEHLARYADYGSHAFIALNTAFLEDGAFVMVPAGTVVETPIHVVHVSTGEKHPQIAHARNLVVIQAGSQASLVETYVSTADAGNSAAYFTNAVTEIVLGEAAMLDHYKVQREADNSFHIATVQVDQHRTSSFRSHSFAFGGGLARTEVNTRLAQGAEATLNGLYVVGGSQHVDTRTSIDHAEPHATSHELYKGILGGRSSAVFNGRIIVRKDAQKTDAKQTNKNLLLSEGATINTKPELQIQADDVRCTHGATIGQLDPESLFYLRSRGIGLDDARDILITAFAREIIDAVKPELLRGHIEAVLAERLVREER